MTLSSDVWLSARAQWDTVTVKPRWRDQARPEQLLPDDAWRTIYFRGGRSGGKTRASAEGFAELIGGNPANEEHGNEWAVVAPTFADARDVCIEGRSGLIHALGGKAGGGRLIERGPLIANWNRSMGQLYLSDGTVIYADGADDGALRVQGKNLRGAWCLSGDTPITTAGGTVPMRAIRPGQFVLTRYGYRPVRAIACTGRRVPMLSITTSTGHVLHCTPEHQLWEVDRGWTRASNLTVGSRLLLDPRPGTISPADVSTASLPATTQPATTSDPNAYTWRFGRTSPGGPFQPATSSITSTMTRRTTHRATSDSCATATTTGTTAPDLSATSSSAPTSTQASSPPGNAGPTGRRHASGVTAASRLGGSTLATAPSNAASSRCNENAGSPSSSEPRRRASGAELASPRRTAAASSVALPAGTPTVVTALGPAPAGDVYDLAVEGAHEFFAAGVLVHNCDEIGLWKRWRTAWDESIKYAVRKYPAQTIASGTPKRNMPAIELVRRLLHDPKVINRRLRTKDNAANLDPAALEAFLESEGTALGAQELEGDVLDEAEGALWTRDPAKADAEKLGLILTERATLSDDTATLTFADRTVALARRVVALDPAEGEGDEQGRTVAAIGADRRYYVLHAAGEHLSPMGWLRGSETVFDRYRADRLIYEKNGAMFLKPLLEQEFPRLPAEMVHASQGKRTRAEPIAALYARRLVTHVVLPGEDLGPVEAQMTSFTGDVGEDSPGQLDALVYALSHLHSRARPARSTSVADMRITG